MSELPGEVACSLADARAGSREALGRALDACRGYLLLVAQGELAPDLRAKGGASDLVQETLLEAYRDFALFHGGSEGELTRREKLAAVVPAPQERRRDRATDPESSQEHRQDDGERVRRRAEKERGDHHRHRRG